ncbi:FAD:protein FMN transferase [Clostridium vincentii]|uniref:FAD:protein FMN transferase n=1 Tax=Clostridium vincentii TaxID=52704 RepID=A0A2T0BFY8_9CLOT|nr:FAD:protein FMN transferase [Clostridium vincentii]PRR82805.1 Thiamine biosynthesis lipoprotein ApbE precursor [Clostridium vincentii]
MIKETLTASSYSLGTLINLRVQGNEAQRAIEEALGRLSDIDDKMSAFKDTSEISKINLKAGRTSQIVGKDTYLVIKEAIKYSRLLEGAFDPTIRPLVSLWNIGTEQEEMPEECEVDNMLQLVNYKDVILDESNSSIRLRREKQALDLGGIAKGYAADEVRDIFYKYNISSALIDLGGNIFAFGGKEDGTPWRVGIQDPFKTRGEFMGVLSVTNKSVVTSGNYEKYFTKAGKRFHHIIDPKTGYPSISKIISATIISDNSIDGDGLSTGVYIIGIDKAMRLIESISGVEAIFITQDKKTYVTSGINNIFTITNKEFLGK